MFQGVLAVLTEHRSQSVYIVHSSDTFVLFLKSCLMDQRIWAGERMRSPCLMPRSNALVYNSKPLKNGCSSSMFVTV